MTLDKATWELEQIKDNPEHDYFEEVIIEKNDISGVKIEYYPLDPDSSGGDFLFGEWKEVAFFGPFSTKITYDPTEETNPLDSFGIFMDETIQFAYIPKGTFYRDVSSGMTDTTRVPVVGDVIITLWDGKKYEVTDVNDADKIFAGSKLIWAIILKPLRYSEDSAQMDTIHDRDPFDMGEDAPSLSDMGDNAEIETESDTIDGYDDVDESIYGH